MKTYSFMIVMASAAFCGCASHQWSQEPSEPVPIVVRADDIYFEGWNFRPMPSEDGTALVGLAFKFKSLSQEKADALFKSGEPAQPVVYIMDDDTVLGRSTLAGYVRGVDVEGQSLNGLVLRFQSVAEARQAVGLLREDPWEALDRRLADRRNWILPPSAGPRDSGLRFPSGGLPNPLPHIYP